MWLLAAAPISTFVAVSFKYDPFGRRIYKSSGSGTSVYAYDDKNLIEEVNSAGSVVARYTHGENIDEPLAMLLRRGDEEAVHETRPQRTRR